MALQPVVRCVVSVAGVLAVSCGLRAVQVPVGSCVGISGINTVAMRYVLPLVSLRVLHYGIG
ncbi:MAG TPA: hypothetical protein ACQGQH_09110 [Xylella sp.]